MNLVGCGQPVKRSKMSSTPWTASIAFLTLLLATPLANAQSKADLLRGEYGKYRSNNDLLYYHLDVRVDPEKKSISGKNTVRFKMLKDDSRIQLDLHSA